MVDEYVKRRALYHAAKGLKPSAISRALADEGLVYSQKSVWTLLRKFRKSHSTNEDLFHGERYRFMQDNDPKHTSKCARTFFAANRIDWWKTPPESPDLNPIENLWHELKECIRREVKREL